MKPTNLEALQLSFKTQAPHFDSAKLHFTKQEYLEDTIRKTAPEKTDIILDVAAGTCICGRSLAPHAGHVVCLDATPAMLEVGKQESENHEIRNITFVKGYAEDLPFLDCSFDIVISRLAFHHFTNVDACFFEMARVLKPGGKLIMIDMTMNDESLRDEVDRIERLRDASHVRDLTLSEMRDLYVRNQLTLSYQEQTDLAVSLESWMELTKTPEASRIEIRKLMKDHLNKKYATGFSPYLVDNEIYFNQHWVFNLGRKE